MSFSNYVETTEDYSNLTLIELKFQEMRREVIRIGEIATDVKSSISSLISAINTLASLVGASSISSSASIGKIEETEKSISKFVTSQIERYASLNEITYERVRILDNLIMQLFDKDGQLVTYEVNGETVTETFTKLLKRKEIETALTNSHAEGYRITDNNALNSNISQEGWNNLETMYAYFSEKGLTDEQISGIFANVAGESWFDANAKNPESTATGFFQWLDSRHPENWEVSTQLDHAWDELENGLNWGGTSTLDRMKTCTTPEQASNVFLQFFECGGPENYETNPAHAGLYPARRTFARSFYNYIQKMKEQSNII